MTPTHKAMLRDVKERIEALAAKVKEAHEAGYLVTFGINPPTGEVKFDIKQMVAIDLDQSSH